jgi:hypothetical protein
LEKAVQPITTAKENSLLAIITNSNLINAICVLFIISSAFMIYRRVVYNWTHTQAQVNFVSYLHGLSMGIPFYFLIITYFAIWFPKTKLTKWLNWITDIKIVAPISLITIILTIVFFLANIPAPLGTWTSIGIAIASILICTSLLRDKLSNILSFTVAIGITGMWIGFWEIPYQTALKLIYDYPQVGTSTTIKWIVWEWVLESPMAGCGLWLLIIINAKYHIVQFNKRFIVLFSAYIILTIIWITSGFWVDVWYNWKENLWVATTEWDKTSMFVYKASKAVMLLAFISLIWRTRNANSTKSKATDLATKTL